MGPACHPLCTIKLSFLELFLAPDIFSLAFFFRSHATFETLSNLQAHGTRMSSSIYYKSSFSWFFFTLWFLAISFFFWSPAASQTVIPLLLNGTRMSSSMYYKTFFSWIIFGSWYLVTCLFLSISCHVWNVEEPAGSWDPHVILYVL